MSEDKVTRLPVKFKAPAPSGRMFVIKKSPCEHPNYLVDEDLNEVECAACHERLNPIEVLRRLATSETLWHHNREAHRVRIEEIKARERTKCQHCRKITRISR